MSSILSHFSVTQICVFVFTFFSMTSGSADAMPQIKFDKRGPIKQSQGSIPKKKIGVGYPSPYSSNYSNSLNRTRSSSSYGRSTQNRYGSYQGRNSYSNNRSNGVGIGNSIILSVPSRSYSYSRNNSSFYRPTLGVGAYPYGNGIGFGTGYGAGFGTTYGSSSYYSSGIYQPYANPATNLQRTNVYPTPTRTLSPTLASTESEARSRLLDDPSYQPKKISNHHYALIATSASAKNYQSLAEQAFKSGRYSDAADLSRLAVSFDPNNVKVKLFASQAYFATGDYARSADYLEQATRSSTNDDWGFVVRNYQRFYGKNDYVSQTDRLSQQIASSPSASALAVRGFNYGSLGYADAATSDFQQALALDRNNVLANRLLPILGIAAEPISPEDIQAPIPGRANNEANSVFETRDRRSDDGIIRLVPQHSDAEMIDSIPVDDGQSILLNGPLN